MAGVMLFVRARILSKGSQLFVMGVRLFLISGCGSFEARFHGSPPRPPPDRNYYSRELFVSLHILICRLLID